MIVGTAMGGRKEQYRLLKKNLRDLISKYCEEKKDSGWSAQAQSFYLELEGWPSPSIDEPLFLKLYQRANEFAQSLFARGTYFVSYLVSQKTIGYYGYGSTLKDQIETLLSDYDPYHIKWIDAEIESQKKNWDCYFLQKGYTPSFIYSFLSVESKQILVQALQDEVIMTALKRDVHLYGSAHYFNDLIKSAKDQGVECITSLRTPKFI